jgi:hypothetical protein
MYLEQLIRIASALLTPLIAMVATYIAWHQWKTNRQKLVMDRYERRLRVYEEVQRILRITLRDFKPGIEDLLKFQTSVSEADFLFGSEIRDYIDEIYRRGLNLQRCNQEYRDFTQQAPPGYDHKKVCDEMNKESTWFTEQFGPAKEIFKRYLDISR